MMMAQRYGLVRPRAPIQSFNMLHRMMFMPTMRSFAVYPQVIEPRSAEGLRDIGRGNYALTKEHGLDYEAILRSTGQKRIAVKNK